MPPALFVGALVVQLVVHLALPVVRLIPKPWNLTGVALIVGGGLVTVLADQQFKRARTTVQPFGMPSAFVADGVFRFSRNPMYLGMVVVLLGVAVVLATLLPFAVPLLYAALLAARFIAAEERNLSARFPEGYAAYARRVRRWL